jgi:hypothetical protein
MKPIEFEGQTKVLSKPSNMTDEECGSLAILNLKLPICVQKLYCQSFLKLMVGF